MRADIKAKVLAKMYENFSITKDELESGNVSDERIQMHIKGVQLLKGGLTVKAQIELRKEQLDNFEKKTESVLSDYSPKGIEEMVTFIKGQLKKLQKIKVKESDVQPNQIKMVLSGAKTQRDEVRMHLNDFKSITSWDAFKDYGITRLSAIIWLLRHDENLDIETETMSRKNRYGNKVNFAKYSLKSENEKSS